MGPVWKGLTKRRLEVVEGGVMVRQRWRTEDVDETVADG
jgi:hypothetical protein